MIRTESGRMFAEAYGAFRRLASQAQSPLLLLMRLYWGWLFLDFGWMKLYDLDRVAHGFASIGIPLPTVMAPFIGCVEFFGGLLLMLGLVSRLAALVLAVNMTVAFATALRPALLAVVSEPAKFFTAAPCTFLIVSLIVLVFGPGTLALDSWIARRYPQESSRELIERRLQATASRNAA